MISMVGENNSDVDQVGVNFMLCLKLRISTQDKEIGFSTNALSLYLISIFSDQMRVKTFSFFQCVNHIQVLNSSHNIFFFYFESECFDFCIWFYVNGILYFFASISLSK